MSDDPDLARLDDPDFSRVEEVGTPRLKRILADSAREAASRDHDFIGVEHVFLAMLAEGGSVPVQLLGRHLDLDGFRAELSSLLDGYGASRAAEEATGGLSDEFETWLTAFDAMYSDLPARGDAQCPDCGGSTLHLVFTGDPATRRGYAQMWCERCVRGIHLSQTLVPAGVPMNDYRMPREERPYQPPDFLLVQP